MSTKKNIILYKGSGKLPFIFSCKNNRTITGTENLQGWNTLTASNLIVNSGAVSDVRARTEIHITGESHLQTGSETHIFTESVFAECADISALSLRHSNPDISNASSIKNNNEAQIKEIEISFQKNNRTNYLIVSSDRTKATYLVQLNSEKENASILNIVVYDMLGREIITSRVNNKTYQLDLSSYPEGVYLLKASDGENIFNKKLIIQ